VDRFFHRLLERRGAAELSVVVLWLPDGASHRVCHRRVLDAGGRSEAALQRGDVDERLEGRPRLSLGLNRSVELAAEEVVSAHDGLDVPRLRLDGDHGALRMFPGPWLRGSRLQRPETVAERLLRRELHGWVERRVDSQSALEDHVGAVLRLQRLLDVFEKVLPGGAPALGWDETEIGLGQAGALTLSQHTKFDQSGQDTA